MDCIIVEDEIPAQTILRNYIDRVPDLELVETFNSAVAARSFLKNHAVDVLFLDINLPDMSGIDFIKTVRRPPAVVMTTAYPDYAAESFELDTITDYLVKPFSYLRFIKAVNKTRERVFSVNPGPTENLDDVVFINVDKAHYKLHLGQILYIESDRNYVTVVTPDDRLTYIDTLKNWKTKLEDKPFIQVHKSFIVNRRHITRLSGNRVFVREQALPIGRSYKPEVMRVLGIN